MAVVLFLATCFLAYSNGANDNAKGVASLVGSRTTSYRNAIGWATVTTFAGSLCAIFLAQALLKAFGKRIGGGPCWTRIRLGVRKEWCICVGKVEQLIAIPQPACVMEFQTIAPPVLNVHAGSTQECREHYTGRFLGLESQQVMDVCHFLSAGVVSFARGLNDTPKIGAMLLAIRAFDIRLGMGMIAIAMAMGGLVGALAGIGWMTGEANVGILRSIVLSWLLTLPCAGISAALVWWVTTRI